MGPVLQASLAPLTPPEQLWCFFSVGLDLPTAQHCHSWEFTKEKQRRKSLQLFTTEVHTTPWSSVGTQRVWGLHTPGSARWAQPPPRHAEVLGTKGNLPHDPAHARERSRQTRSWRWEEAQQLLLSGRIAAAREGAWGSFLG